MSTPRDGFTAAPTGGGPRSVAAATNEDVASSPESTAVAAGAQPTKDAAVATGGPAAQGASGASGQPGAPSAASAAPAVRGSTVGLTSDTITISVLAGFTGSYGGLMKLIADNGYGLWADEINANGGINGRKVVLKQVDNHDTAEGGVAACKQVQNNGSFLAISLAGLGGADLSSADCLDQAKIPMFGQNLAAYRSNWRYVVSMNDDAKQAAPLASFIKNVIGDGGGKIGMIVVNDPIHLAAREQVKRDLERLQMNHARDEVVAVGQGSFVAELSRLRSAGATTVAMLTGNESIGIVRDAKAINYSPNFTGVLWTLDEFSQAAGPVWSGIKAIRVWPTTDSQAYQSYAAKARKYGRDSLVNSTVMAVYGSGLLLGDILKRAGAGLSREAFVSLSEGINDYDNGIIALSFGGKRVADIKAFPLVCCNSDNTWKGTGPARREF